MCEYFLLSRANTINAWDVFRGLEDALDAAFYPQDANDWAEYLDPFLVRLCNGYIRGDRYWEKNNATFLDCSGENNHNVDIFDSWL
jgi:hypothetical protein